MYTYLLVLHMTYFWQRAVHTHLDNRRACSIDKRQKSVSICRICRTLCWSLARWFILRTSCSGAWGWNLVKPCETWGLFMPCMPSLQCMYIVNYTVLSSCLHVWLWCDFDLRNSLQRHLRQVLGVDFSQAFIDAAERMRKGEAMECLVPSRNIQKHWPDRCGTSIDK